MIRILICDDQSIVRQGLEVILGTAPDMEVVGSAADGEEAVHLVSREKPDVVLMDLKMPRVNGVQATKRIKEAYPDINVLVLTTYDIDEWLFGAIRNGANGYLLKDSPAEELLAAIRGTAEGKSYLDPNIAGKVLTKAAQVPEHRTPSAAEYDLTRRELAVLCLLAKGMTNTEIARDLTISEGTVRNYISTIFDKLGVNDRTKAAIMAIRYGFIELNDL